MTSLKTVGGFSPPDGGFFGRGQYLHQSIWPMAVEHGCGVNFLRRARFINGDSKDGSAGENCYGSQDKSLRILGFSE